MWSSLVSVEDLAAAVDRPGLRLIDVRHDISRPDKGYRQWLAGRLPGAVFLHLDSDLSGPLSPTSGRHPLPEIEAFRAVLRRAGLRPDSQVVVYDDQGGGMACRLWWMLQEVGHPAVAVLDGGVSAWVAAGLPLQIGPGRLGASTGYTPPGAFTRWVDLTPDTSGECPLVDARDPERFHGWAEPIDPVAGHIPGARNLPWRDNLLPDGRFRPIEQLRERFAGLTRPVFYCGSGVTACHNVFAFRLAGGVGDRLYSGSWSRWAARYPERYGRDPAGSPDSANGG